MEKSLFRISLDIHRQTTQEHLAVKKGDTARCIIITLTDGGLPYAIGDGCYAVFMGQKHDGNVLYNACTIENGQIIYDFTEQTVSMVGRMPCEVRLYGADDALITSPRIAIIVSGTVYDDSEVESTAEFTALSEAMTELLELKEQNEEFTVTITGSDADGYTADNDVYDIITADWKGQACVCHWGAVKLPLVRLENDVDVAYFAAVVDGIEYRVEIRPDDNEQTGVVAVSEELGRGVFDVTVTGNDDGTYSADRTYEEIRAAETEGMVLQCKFNHVILSWVADNGNSIAFGCVLSSNSYRIVINSDNTVTRTVEYLATTDEIPVSLKNPNALTINGIAYDGSEAVMIDIEDGYTPVKGTDYFTDADKQELVDAVLAALPAAEGVSY